MDRHLLALSLVLTRLVWECGAVNAPPSAEHRLLHDIFADYQPAARSTTNQSEPVEIEVSYYLFSVKSLEWTDDLLGWDPSNYSGIDMVVVPADRVWLPDVYFPDGVEKMIFEAKNFLPRITANGTVQHSPGGSIVLSCLFDMERYPFDEQTCVIRISCWSNTVEKVTLVAREFGLDYASENGEWTIIDHYLSDGVDVDVDGTYSMIHFVLKLRRKALFHVINILLPVVLLSLLNLMVFRLPPKSGEKVSLSITVLLAFSVWLIMLTDIMPNTSERIPIVGVYITMFMVISTVSVIATVYVIRIHSTKKSNPIPRWVHKVFEMRNKLSPNKVHDGSTAADGIVPRTSLTWKELAALLDDIALYTLSSCILILVGVVIRNLV